MLFLFISGLFFLKSLLHQVEILRISYLLFVSCTGCFDLLLKLKYVMKNNCIESFRYSQVSFVDSFGFRQRLLEIFVKKNINMHVICRINAT